MKQIVISSAIAAILGISVGYFIRGEEGSGASSSNEKEVLYWVAPMDANFRRDKPGKSPMGMDLVPVYADDASSSDNTSVNINGQVTNNISVKVASVKKQALQKPIITVGTVTVNENSIEKIHAFADGWVKKLLVKTSNEHVNKGEPLLTLFSPSIVAAQEELLLAIASNNKTLVVAGVEKLKTLGMQSSEIAKLRKSKKVIKQITISSPISGVVSKLNIREGQFIKPSNVLMTIENYETAWIIADVFERQSSWVKAGQNAVATLPYVADKKWQGKIDYVYPSLNSKTHTLPIRMIFPNPDLSLKPNMFVDITIFTDEIKDVLTVPTSAVIRTGEMDRVVTKSEDSFKSVPIKLGLEASGYYQVLDGLNENDEVVVSGQFLIDSESSKKMDMMRMGEKGQPDMPTKKILGAGTIIDIDKLSRMVTIHHEALPDADMPEMEMQLSVADSVDLQEAKKGDAVHFVIVANDDGYELNMLHVMPGGGHD